VNNTGTRYVRIMKQTAFLRGKKESILDTGIIFLILAHLYKNVNNTGTKYVRIVKQTTF